MSHTFLEISIPEQTLTIFSEKHSPKIYPISSGKNGVGERYGSEQTPGGHHMIYQKIGSDCPHNTVFIARKPTGEIYTSELAEKEPNRDWILTRILWLMGLEPGKNRFGQVDTRRRKIYIHGTPDSTFLGKPGSRGCIRMNNDHLIEVFNRVEPGTRVNIITE